MKIIHVIPFYAPAWGYGGPVRVSYDIANEFAKRGHEVNVWTTDAYDHSKRIDQVCEEIEKVKITRFRNLSNKLAKGYNLYLPLGFARHCRLNLKKADVIHLHSFYTVLNIIAARYANKYKIPYVVHLHESPVANIKLGKVLIKKVFIALYGRKILENASMVLTLTTKEKKITANAYPKIKDKISVLPNTIAIQAPSKLDKTLLRSKYKFLKNHKILLSLSRLSNLKRVDKTVFALKALLEQDPDFRLIVAGPDESGNLSKLKNIAHSLQIEDKILFTGPVVGRAKEEVYQLADVYVLLADYESFSITTLEALSYDLPVVLSENIGVSDDLAPFGVSVVTKTDTIARISKAIAKTYQNRQALKKNAQKAIGLFNLETVCDKLEAIYNQIK